MGSSKQRREGGGGTPGIQPKVEIQLHRQGNSCSRSGPLARVSQARRPARRRRPGGFHSYLIKPPHIRSLSNRLTFYFSEPIQGFALAHAKPALRRYLPTLSPPYRRPRLQRAHHQATNAVTHADKRTTKAATAGHESGHTRESADHQSGHTRQPADHQSGPNDAASAAAACVRALTARTRTRGKGHHVRARRRMRARVRAHARPAIFWCDLLAPGLNGDKLISTRSAK